MSNNQEQSTQNKVLTEILKERINELLVTYKEELKAMLAENPTLPPLPHEPKIGERNLTTVLVKQQIMSFTFPETCDLSRLRDRNLVSTKLKDWTVETRQRNTNKCDTYYRHPTADLEFRSIREVVNHILLEEGVELEKRKKTKKENQGETSNKKSKTEIEGEEGTSKVLNEEDIDGTLSDEEINELLRNFVEKKLTGKGKEIAK